MHNWFRQSLAGMHNEMIFPDIVIYGKAMGNGYPINAILGKKKSCLLHLKHLSVVHFGLSDLAFCSFKNN